jgi:TetR/AcrR family transcriptional repressor of nem operon
VGNAPTTRRGQNTKIRILDTTAELIRVNGVAATTLDCVEQACSVGRSQLYYYFTDRADLLRQVAAHVAHPLITRTTEALASPDHGLSVFEGWFDMMLAANRASGGVGGCPLGSLIGQLAERDEKARAVLAESFGQWQQPVQAALRTLQTQGDLRADVDTDVLADQLMAAVQGGLLLAQVRRDPDQLRRALAGALQLLQQATEQPSRVEISANTNA